jgi:hypothetical protein
MNSINDENSKLKILLTKINGELREDWLREELDNGKNIILRWVWTDVLSEAIQHYKAKGWLIRKTVVLGNSNGRKLILNFKNPRINLNF